jgi:ABC-type transport system involved in multi-copper enzyme maturation permease subunit
MFWDIFRFEVAYHRRQPLVYIVTAVFFLIAFLATTSPNVTIGGGTSNLNINSPFAIMQSLASISLLCVFTAVAFSANPVIRDYEYGTAEFFLSTSVDKFSYLFGRFTGALVFSCITYLGGVAGAMLGEFMPWLDPQRIGEFRLYPYVFATWAIAIPNIVIVSCIFFCLATTTRRVMAAYVGAVALLMLFFVMNAFDEPDTVALTSKLDPFGIIAFGEITRYWTVFDKNQAVPSLEGNLLLDRVLWLGIAGICLVLAYRLFPFSMDAARSKSNKRALDPEENLSGDRTKIIHGLRLVANPNFDVSTYFAQYLSQTRLEVRNIVVSTAFWVLLVFGLLNVTAGALGNLGNYFGTSVYPTTGFMLTMINGAFSLSLIIVLIYYSAELLVRERAAKVAEILDALPYPNWVMIASKLTGLLLVMMSMLCVAMIAAIGIQVYKGYYDLNIPLYLSGLLFYFQFPMYLMCVVGVFLVVLTRSKNLTMLLMVLYFISLLALPQMGLEHYLYRFASPGSPYSAFTGFEHNALAVFWYSLYWTFVGILLLVMTHLLWTRGIPENWALRKRLVVERMGRPVLAVIVVSVIGCIGTGSYIYYNTNVLNSYITSDVQEQKQAEYEKKYKQYEYIDQPKTTRVYVEVDIYPAEKEAVAKGYYDLTNRADVAISDIHLGANPQIEIDKLAVPGSSLFHNDEELGYRIYRLATPLPPGSSVRVEFETAWRTPGFVNSNQQTSLTTNGSFFNNTELLPLVGYQGSAELLDNSVRRRYDLAAVKRAESIDDESAWMRNQLGNVDRVEFETVVSTSTDQIAIAPGYIQKEWVDGNRRYFHYKMDAPIWNFFSFMSADYRVQKDRWNDVNIEVYYLHDVNVQTMIHSARTSLEYFTKHFSPYQYRQFRVIEFPSFRGRFAQSFPNTIPFSEAIGFIADLRDKEEIDYVFYVTAHELAHQWWAHQVLGADVQGATMIVESLAQYSALMVMEQEYGEEHMQRFLKYELDRYLSDRGGEILEELPLMLVENQPYIHYRKGSVNLYALKDYIGEEAVNRALNRILQEYAFKPAPYPTTRHVIANFRKEAPDEYQDIITDLFEKIVLFDLRVADSSVRALDKDQFEVTINVTARKFEADGEGREAAVPVDGLFDIAVLGEEMGESKIPEVLYMEKHRINSEDQTFTIIVNKQPVSVGIDPYNKMIDRNPEDNTRKVKGRTQV